MPGNYSVSELAWLDSFACFPVFCFLISAEVSCCLKISLTPASACLSAVGAQSGGLGAISIMCDHTSHDTSLVAVGEFDTISSICRITNSRPSSTSIHGDCVTVVTGQGTLSNEICRSLARVIASTSAYRGTDDVFFAGPCI